MSEQFTQKPIAEELAHKITGLSWKPEGPVALADLAHLQLLHHGFDGQAHTGEMIVHRLLAAEVLEIFEELHTQRFPIEKIRLIDDYGADDDKSTTDNNSSALCVRRKTGKPHEWSSHSFGTAIDINPLQNPYVKGDVVLPEAGRNYLDRGLLRQGMIIESDMCHRAFVDRGWAWGGHWQSLKDYQHFEKKLPPSPSPATPTL